MANPDSSLGSNFTIPRTNRVLDFHSLNNVFRKFVRQLSDMDENLLRSMTVQEFADQFRENFLTILNSDGFCIAPHQIGTTPSDVWQGSGDPPHFCGYEKIPTNSPVFCVKISLFDIKRVVSRWRELFFRSGHVIEPYIDIIVKPPHDLRA